MGVPPGAVLNKMVSDGVESPAAALRALSGARGADDAGLAAAALPPPSSVSSRLGLSPELSQHLDALFQPRADAPRDPAAPSAADAARPRSVTLLDKKRAMQIGLGLSRLKGFTRGALLDMLRSLVPRALSAEQAALLADCVPRAAEASALHAWTAAHPADAHRLADTDTFSLECAGVADAAARADALLFRVGVAERLDELAASAAALSAAAVAVAHNRALQRIASAAVALAARIPAALPAAGGFDLLSLRSLGACRVPGVHVRDARGTVLHVLAAILDRTDAEAAAFTPDASVIAGATGAFGSLNADLTALESGAAAFRALAPPDDPRECGAAPHADASAPASVFADAQEKAIARLRTAVVRAGDLFSTSWSAFRVGAGAGAPHATVPAPEVVFAAIVDFAHALKKARAELVKGKA
jgi:hypothetical protein